MQTENTSLLFQSNPIIASIRNPKEIYKAVDSDVNIIFLLTGNIFNLKKMVEHCNAANKAVYVHLDLIKGFGQDSYFLRYLKEEINPTGIISTKNALIIRAKEEKLKTIQRMFLLDSGAVDNALSSIRKIKPDAVEVLPGLVPKMIKRINESIEQPIITGGFIETEAEVKACLDAGALSISTSCEALWKLNKISN